MSFQITATDRFISHVLFLSSAVVLQAFLFSLQKNPEYLFISFFDAMKLQPLLGCALIPFIPITLALTGPDIAAYLEKILSPGTDFYLPTDSNYTAETTQRWNAYGAPTYVVSVKPALEGDVQKIVRSFYSPRIKSCGRVSFDIKANRSWR